MRIVFFGTPDVAAQSLYALLASSHEVVGVVTQPDRPRGRGRSVQPSPVKELATQSGLPVLQPGRPAEPGFADILAALAPDALAVVAYGHILPPGILRIAPAVNVHFSLLPHYRGAAPVQRALMDGATETGVSVFLLEPTVDTGPVLLREEISIEPEATAGDVLALLAPIGAALLVRALDALESGTAAPVEQSDMQATPARKISTKDAKIEWAASAEGIVNLVRGLNPRPGAFTTFRGRRLGIWRARACATPIGLAAGVIAAGSDLIVGTGDAPITLLEVQPEGKRTMSGVEFVRGYRPHENELLGDGLA
ncbi:MAG: methionyl-tRNA formyltransferase [Actinomycetota bacterium]